MATCVHWSGVNIGKENGRSSSTSDSRKKIVLCTVFTGYKSSYSFQNKVFLEFKHGPLGEIWGSHDDAYEGGWRFKDVTAVTSSETSVSTRLNGAIFHKTDIFMLRKFCNSFFNNRVHPTSCLRIWIAKFIFSNTEDSQNCMTSIQVYNNDASHLISVYHSAMINRDPDITERPIS
jgi:hypothetical protein